MKHKFSASTLAACLALISSVVQSQSFPTKPVHFVVPFPSGGSSDFLMRTVGDQLAADWHQTVVVDNIPGKGTVTGTEAVARATPDGYTLLLVSAAFVINPALRPGLPYDVMKDFVPITLFADSPIVIAANASFPARSLQELTAMAKDRPGQLSIAGIGPGTTQHVLAEMLKAAAKVDMVFTPFAGGPQAVKALLENRVTAVIAAYSEVAQQIASGELRPLAVASRNRIDVLKDVPTIAESGLKDIEAAIWFGVVAPAGTPKDIVATIQNGIGNAIKVPGVIEKLNKQSMYPAQINADQFAAHLLEQSHKFTRVIKEAGIKVN